MSVTLSTSVVIVSDSTGSRPIVSNSLMTEPFARGPRPRTTEDKHPGGKERGAGYVGRPPEATDHRSPRRSLALSARVPSGRRRRRPARRAGRRVLRTALRGRPPPATPPAAPHAPSHGRWSASRSLTLGVMTAAWRFDGRVGPLETRS